MSLLETFRNQTCFISVHISIHVSFLFENPFASEFGFYTLDASIKDHTWLSYMDYISNFMALSHLSKSELTMASYYDVD